MFNNINNKYLITDKLLMAVFYHSTSWLLARGKYPLSNYLGVDIESNNQTILNLLHYVKVNH